MTWWIQPDTRPPGGSETVAGCGRATASRHDAVAAGVLGGVEPDFGGIGWPCRPKVSGRVTTVPELARRLLLAEPPVVVSQGAQDPVEFGLGRGSEV